MSWPSEPSVPDDFRAAGLATVGSETRRKRETCTATNRTPTPVRQLTLSPGSGMNRVMSEKQTFKIDWSRINQKHLDVRLYTIEEHPKEPTPHCEENEDTDTLHEEILKLCSEHKISERPRECLSHDSGTHRDPQNVRVSYREGGRTETAEPSRQNQQWRNPHYAMKSHPQAHSLPNVGSATSGPSDSNQSNVAALSCDRSLSVAQHPQGLAKVKCTRFALPEEAASEDIPVQRVSVNSKPLTERSHQCNITGTSSPLVRAYCSIQNLLSPEVMLENRIGCDQSCSGGVDAAQYHQGRFAGVEYASANRANAHARTVGLSPAQKTVSLGRDLEASTRALCSYRFLHHGRKDLVLQEVSQDPCGACTLVAVSSITSVGVTCSEPAACDDRSDLSSYSPVSGCSLSLTGTEVPCHSHRDTYTETFSKTQHDHTTNPAEFSADTCQSQRAAKAELSSLICYDYRSTLSERSTNTSLGHTSTSDLSTGSSHGHISASAEVVTDACHGQRASTAESYTGSCHSQVATPGKQLCRPALPVSTEFRAPCSRVFAIMATPFVETIIKDANIPSGKSPYEKIETGPVRADKLTLRSLRLDCHTLTAHQASSRKVGMLCASHESSTQRSTATSATWNRLPLSWTVNHNVICLDKNNQLEEKRPEAGNLPNVFCESPKTEISCHESKVCSSWSALIDFVQNRSTCPVLSPTPKDITDNKTTSSPKTPCHFLHKDPKNKYVTAFRPVRCPRILELSKENTLREHSFIIDAGVCPRKGANATLLNSPTPSLSVRRKTAYSDKGNRDKTAREPDAGMSVTSMNEVTWDLEESPACNVVPAMSTAGSCSDIAQEALPLRAVWRTARQRGLSYDLGMESEDYDTDGQREPTPARTASSLELQQNLQIARVAAVQNMSSACPYMPWSGNVDTASRHTRQRTAGSRQRESESEYSTTPGRSSAQTVGEITSVSEQSTDEMEERESVEPAAYSSDEGARFLTKLETLSRLGTCRKPAFCAKSHESRKVYHCPDLPDCRTNRRQRSRSPVHSHGGHTHPAHRRSVSTLGDVASMCSRSACARRQYAAVKSDSDANSWASTSVHCNSYRGSNLMHGDLVRPILCKHHCSNKSEHILSSNHGIHNGTYTDRCSRPPHCFRFNPIRTDLLSDKDSENEWDLLEYGNTERREATFNPVSNRRTSRPYQLRKADLFPTIPLSSALMHNCSNNTSSLSRTSFKPADGSHQQSRDRERQSATGAAGRPQLSHNPPSPLDRVPTPDCGAQRTVTDTPVSPTLPIFSLHTQWHSFVNSSVRNTAWPFSPTPNTTFFPSNTGQHRARGIAAKHSLRKKTRFVSAFSGVDPSKKEERVRQEAGPVSTVTPRPKQPRMHGGDGGCPARRRETSSLRHSRCCHEGRAAAHSHHRHRQAEHSQELLYMQARAVLRQMCYMRSKEELLFQAAIRFQHKRLQLQEQHSRLVNRARAVGHARPHRCGYRASSPTLSTMRGTHHRSHRRLRLGSSHCTDVHKDCSGVTSGAVRVGLKDSQSVHDSLVNNDEPSTSQGVRKRHHSHRQCSCKRARVGRNMDRDRDTDSSAFGSKSSATSRGQFHKADDAARSNVDDDNEEEDDDDDSRTTDGSDDDEGDDDVDDDTKKSSTKLDDDAKSESTDDESDSPRNAGFYREQ